MGDRGGGREGKGISLKNSKKNPGSKVAKAKKAPKDEHDSKKKGASSPVVGVGSMVDCGSALLSRQFERDRDRVITRAGEQGVGPILCWFADVQKQEDLQALIQPYKGQLYLVAGVHPDNISRTNKAAHDTWISSIKMLARDNECVGIISGLNCTREVATHFPQEKLLRSCISLASETGLCLILHLPCDAGVSLKKTIDILEEESFSGSAILFDTLAAVGSDEDTLKVAIDYGFYCAVSGVGITDTNEEIRDKAMKCCKAIPSHLLLSCTNSPGYTPQNLSDPYLRTLRNEPSNLYAVVQAISDAKGTEIVKIMWDNAFRVFNLSGFDSVVAPKEIEQMVVSVSEMITDNSVEEVVLESENSPTTTSSSSKGMYSCRKCRQNLFDTTDISIHALDATKTVFTVGEEGLCQAAVFVKGDDFDRFGIVVMENIVQCSKCNTKIGKFSFGDLPCPCGAVVSGPGSKLVASKLDYFVGSSSENLARAAMQRLELDEETEDDPVRALKNKKKKKKIRSEKTSNLSSYRNKDFKPKKNGTEEE